MPSAAHPPTHVLAELSEGALDDTTAADVSAHVRQCPDCQRVVERLDHLTIALRELPDELPVPEHVAARISAALAAERATAEVVGTRQESNQREQQGGPVAWFRRRVPQALAAAASVAVLGLAGYVAITSGDGDGDSSTAAEAASDDAAGSDQRGENLSQPQPNAAEDTAGEEARSDGDALPEVSSFASEALVRDVWTARAEVSPGCGQTMADDAGQTLVGSVTTSTGVLVVLVDDAGDQLTGWLVPSCAATTDDALDAPIVTAVPS